MVHPSAQTDPTLRAEAVTAGYPGRAHVLQAVSFEARAGHLTAVIGANGAGKTTLLRALLGVVTPAQGTVRLHGRDIANIPVAARARTMCYVAQRASIAFAYSALEVVQLGCPWLTGSRAVAAAMDALCAVEIADRAHEPLGALSVGQQQRVSLARALAQLDTRPDTSRPGVLLADEPAASMDPAHALATLDILKARARAGACVVVVLHDLLLASRYADAALLLHADGTTAAHGPTADVLRADSLAGVYNIPFTRVPLGATAAYLPSALAGP